MVVRLIDVFRVDVLDIWELDDDDDDYEVFLKLEFCFSTDNFFEDSILSVREDSVYWEDT